MADEKVTKVWVGDAVTIPNVGDAVPNQEIELPVDLAAQFEAAGKCKDVVKPRRRSNNSEE